MTHVGRRLLLLPLAALALAWPGRALAGDESPAADDRARAVAAALENENLRMRALIDAASILEKAGRRDEAIAALRGVEGVRAESKALLERVLQTSSPLRIRPNGRPSVVSGAAAAAVTRTPHQHLVAAGVRELISARGPDRFWRSAPAGAGPADLGTTGMAVLALLEASDPENMDAHAEEGLSAGSDAAKVSLTALAAVHDAVSGRFLAETDPEAHAIVTWALAAGLTRFGDPAWRAPLQSAVARALADRNARGLWPSASGTPDDDWTLAGFEVAMLHEATHHGSLVEGLGVADAIRRAGSLAFADQIAETQLVTAAGAYARACLARQARRALGLPDGPFLPKDAREIVFDVPRAVSPGAGPDLDAPGLLFATALRVGGDADDLSTWRRRVLEPVLAQGLDGTWHGGDPRSLRHGRDYASACVLLAWLAPTSQVRFPKSP